MACVARNELLEGIEALPPDADIDDSVIVDVRRTKEAAGKPLPEKNTNNLPVHIMEHPDEGDDRKGIP